MAQVSRRAGFTGSALIRLLARWSDRDVGASADGITDRLSQWLGWADAVSLSTALSGASNPVAPHRADRPARGSDADEVARVRAALAKTIVEGGLRDTDDFTMYRHHHVSRQHAMEASIAPLRTRLRSALARRSPEMARLAAVDAVMEHALGPHERSLLATVPALLEKQFARSRADGESFAGDMQAVLLAELDMRLQPIEGLLDALRVK